MQHACHKSVRYEFEVWLATHEDLKQGNVSADIRKVLVGDASNSTEAYNIALDMCWREPYQVTKVHYVP